MIRIGWATAGFGDEPATYVQSAEEDFLRRTCAVQFVHSVTGSCRFPGAFAFSGQVVLEPSSMTFHRFDPGSREEPRSIVVRRGIRQASAFWLSPNSRVMNGLADRGHSSSDAVAGVGYALAMVAGMYVKAPPTGIHVGYPCASRTGSGRSAVFLIGNSIDDSQTLLDQAASVLQDTFEIVESCECRRGCASCVGVHSSDNGTSQFHERGLLGVPDKRAVTTLLRQVLEAPSLGTQPSESSFNVRRAHEA